MSGNTPTPAEPAASTSSKSLADRITTSDQTQSNGTSAAPAKFNWADEVETPVAEKGQEQTTASTAGNTSDLEDAQKDGATTWLMGSKLDEPEFDVNVTLHDLQDDPNNPLYSVKSFEELGLPEPLQRGLSVMNFSKPSKIQERALPLLMNTEKNFIGQSQSGTGKTAAFVLNMLKRVDIKTQQPQALVLAPTRELARQISGVCKMMGTFLIDEGLMVTEAIPNPAMRNQQFVGQILVGTPGTVGDAIKRKHLDTSGITILTLDEADNMLDMTGMGDQCIRVKRMLRSLKQTVLFSATFPDKVMKFATDFAPQAHMITLQTETLTVKGIKQMYLDCNSDEEKYNALIKFYGLMTIASSIIFVRTKATAQKLSQRMKDEDHAVATLSGGMEPAERDEVFNKFRKGEAKVLITTNVLARGIDVQTVTMVVNYDIPTDQFGNPDYETYLHRIGRTGRFGRTGAALSFVHDRASWQQLMDICKHFQVEPTKLDTSDWDEVEKMLKMIMRNARNQQAGERAMAD